MKATPQRLKTMTKEQLIARVLSNEEALEKAQVAIAAAVRQEREACAAEAESNNSIGATRHEIAAAIRASSEASHE